MRYHLETFVINLKKKLYLQVYNKREWLFHREENMKRSIVFSIILICYSVTALASEKKWQSAQHAMVVMGTA